MLAPLFGARGVPNLVKLSIAGCLSIILYPMVQGTNPNIPDQLLLYIGVLIKEILLGLTVGFVISAITSILSGAGQMIDYHMGFMMANSIDPINGMQTPLLGQFLAIVATMLLLATNMHHYLIAAMVKSYSYIPLNPSGMPASISYYTGLISQIFSLSIQIAMPVIGAIVLADIGMGLLGRAVPQLQIFAVIFPSKIIFGFVILILSIPFWAGSISGLFNSSMTWVLELYRGWK